MTNRRTNLLCIDCRQLTDMESMTEVNDFYYCRECLPNAPKPPRSRKR